MKSKSIVANISKLLIVLVALASVVCIAFSVSAQSYASAAESSAGLAANLRYYADYGTWEETVAASEEVNLQITAEGMVLLKNKDAALPLKANERKVSLFGCRSDNIIIAGTSAPNSLAQINDVGAVLEEGGFLVNGVLRNLYATDNTTVPELPVSFLASAKGSYDIYKDVAFVVITREASEGADAYKTDDDGKLPGHKDNHEHYLQLQDNERALIEEAKTVSDKVIILFNSQTPVQIPELEDDDAIDAIIQIGQPGQTGLKSLPKILTGEVNPSAKTVDVWAADFTKDPVFQNHGDNRQTNYVTDKYVAQSSILDTAGKEVGKGYNTLDYEEGIYMGYRWYETAAKEGVLDNAAVHYEAAKGTIPAKYNGDKYYNRSTGVVYPFGFGLSYTDFTWDIVDAETTQPSAFDPTGNVTITVEVTNNGDVAGKDVVQAYYSAQYYNGGIEKSDVDLVGFAKTDLIPAGGTDTVKITFKARDMASFDYNDANGNDFRGYELEAGNYVVSLRSDSHTVKDAQTVTYNVSAGSIVGKNGAKTAFAKNATEGKGANGYAFSTDDTTDNPVTTIFSNDDEFTTHRTKKVTPDSELKFMSRSSFTTSFPAAPTVADRTFSDAAIATLKGQNDYYAFEDKETDPWYIDDAEASTLMAGWQQAASVELDLDIRADQGKTIIRRKDGTKAETQLAAMTGKTLEDPAWTGFMNQLTWEEMVTLIGEGWRYIAGVESIGKPVAFDEDGPGQLGMASGLGMGNPDYHTDSGYIWAACAMMSSTWNVELAEQEGRMIGNESLIQNMNGWYGPGSNTHRSPFSGRNYEYYSQDGVQGGLIGAYVCRGATDKGVNVYLKHYGLNDQESNRSGVCTWASEQAIRQIYNKQYELPVKIANITGTMSALNRMGLQPSANFALYNKLTCDEWGFDGYTITDRNSNKGIWTKNMLARTFGVPLAKHSEINKDGHESEGIYDAAQNKVLIPASVEEYKAGKNTKISNTQWYWVRMTAQRVLYVTANGNAMDNAVDLSSFESDAEMTGIVGKEFTKSLAASMADMGAISVRYGVSGGSLPAGVTLDPATGVLSGTPAQGGTYTFQIEAWADSWIRKTADYTLTVASSLSVEAETPAKAGEAFEGQLVSSVFTVQPTVKPIFESDNLPAGLTMDKEGKITGTPSAAGTFDVNIKITYGSGRNAVVANDVLTITITAGETVPPFEIGDNGNWFINGVDTGISATGPKGDKGDKGDTAGDNAQPAEGCGSLAGGATVVIVASVLALTVAGFVIFKAKRKKD